MKNNLDRMYQSYFYDIYRFLLSLCHNHHTAEDLVQETFFRAYLFIENYEQDNIKTWLFTVARHAYIDHYRKHKRTDVKEKSYFEAFFDKDKTPEETVIMQGEIQEIVHLLGTLPKKQKLAVLLHDFHELSYREAAQVMDVKLSHFKVLLFRGRQAIRNQRSEKNE